MVYQVLSHEDIMTEKYVSVIKDMWGFDRQKKEFKIPTGDGYKIVNSEQEGIASAMVRNYWFGRHYGLIDPGW
jgi:hypothetical protein